MRKYMMQITDSRLPGYVRRNLEYYLDHLPENPDRFNPIIDDICKRWGILWISPKSLLSCYRKSMLL